MTESAANAYATNSNNTSATAPNKVAVLVDANGNLQQYVIPTLGDGSSNAAGTPSNPISNQAADGALATVGTTTDLSSATTLVGLLKKLIGLFPGLGQKNMAGSNSVAIASDQSAVPVSGAVTANAGTNLNTSALALDTSVSALAALVQNLTDILSEAQFAQVAVPFARDASDQMFVNIAQGIITSLQQIFWGANNLEPVYYSTGSPNSMDQREMQEMQSEVNFNSVRTQRWVFS